MARVFAFLLFTSAAVDWPGWFLDRAGTALLGLAFLAVAVARPAGARAVPSALSRRVGATIGRDDEEVAIPPVLRRLEEYTR